MVASGEDLHPPGDDRGARAAASSARLRGMREDGEHLDAPAHVPLVREDRLLRQLTEQARDGALPGDRASADPLGRAVRGMVVVLRRRDAALPRRIRLARWRRRASSSRLSTTRRWRSKRFGSRPATPSRVTDSDRDTLVYVVDGSGSLALEGAEAEALRPRRRGTRPGGGGSANRRGRGRAPAARRDRRGGCRPARATRRARNGLARRRSGRGESDGRALVPDPARPPQRLDARDPLRRLRPARKGSLALPPLRRDRVGGGRPGAAAHRRDRR